MRGVGAKGSFFTLLVGDVELTKETFTGEMHQVSLLLMKVVKKYFYHLKGHCSKASLRVIVLS